MVRVLQVTDSHLLADSNAQFLGMKPVETFYSVIDHLKKEVRVNPPDIILFTGDLSQDDSEASYQIFIDAIQDLPRPIAWIPGNHDNPLQVKDLFEKEDILLQKQIAFDRWHIILLNTFWRNHVAGELKKEELLFFNQTLQDHAEKNSVVFLHHHVLPVRSFWLDQSQLRNSDEMLEILDRYSHVRMVVSGHVHQESKINRRGIEFITTPSTSIQFKVHSDQFALDTMMPGYRWFNLFEDGSHETEVVRISYREEFVPDLQSEGY